MFVLFLCAWAHCKILETEGQILILFLQSRFLSFYLVPRLLPGTGLANQNRNPHVFSSVCVFFFQPLPFFDSLLRVSLKTQETDPHILHLKLILSSVMVYLVCLFFGFRSFVALSTRKPAYWTSLLMVISITSWSLSCFIRWCCFECSFWSVFRPCSPSLSTGWWRVSSNDLQLSPHGITSFGILVLGSRFFTSRKCEVVCFFSFFLPLILAEDF